ncbi:hypothetical protein C882_0002 [Caenispirillum salinarum AK4]|uniref:Uncharacterized protein n=1 Tax=Caenispirillum salinarum AK4 TaxID=1238182 RepID=K9H760_9PROT|nr:hypothetical protein C882_0002 [Caenispirillum salinarum AK4]
MIMLLCNKRLRAFAERRPCRVCSAPWGARMLEAPVSIRRR